RPKPRQNPDDRAKERADGGDQEIQRRERNAKAQREMIKNSAHRRSPRRPVGSTTSSALSNSRKKATPRITPLRMVQSHLPPNSLPTIAVMPAVAITKPAHWNRKA